jgi:hypothetical protein
METRTFELEFAKFIERFHEDIKEAFLDDAVQKRELLSGYHLGRQMLQDLADSVVVEFRTNIDKRTSVEIIAERYVEIGMRCCQDGVSCAEMVRAFSLLKRHIWLFFQESNFAGQPFDVRSIVALNNRTALFFDRAVYYFLSGYEQAKSEACSDLELIYRQFIAKVRRDLDLK